MTKKEVVLLGILFLGILLVSGCDKFGKQETDSTEFEKGPEGLVMEFVPNYPADNYIVGNQDEPISILVDVRNKGTYPPEGDSAEHTYFGNGKFHLSGFDTSIIDIKPMSKEIGNPFKLYLEAASNINPVGGIDTAEFEGVIKQDKILIDEYNPTILVTACYPYFTKTTPAVCIDPKPFDTRQEKVCTVGSQNLETQGAPISVTRIDQEAAGNKIQFKITIENVGNGDVMWKGWGSDFQGLLKRCSPLEKDSNGEGRLLRDDFDRVLLEKVKIGSVDLFANGKCAPFADGTNNIIRLFNGEGFVICTLDINSDAAQEEFANVQSAYTTPIDIGLRYMYRSTISKPIQIKKLTTI
jgi:hypothetical protein